MQPRRTPHEDVAVGGSGVDVALTRGGGGAEVRPDQRLQHRMPPVPAPPPALSGAAAAAQRVGVIPRAVAARARAAAATRVSP